MTFVTIQNVHITWSSEKEHEHYETIRRVCVVRFNHHFRHTTHGARSLWSFCFRFLSTLHHFSHLLFSSDRQSPLNFEYLIYSNHMQICCMARTIKSKQCFCHFLRSHTNWFRLTVSWIVQRFKWLSDSNLLFHVCIACDDPIKWLDNRSRFHVEHKMMHKRTSR